MRRPAPRPRSCAAKPRLSIVRRSRRSRVGTTSVPYCMAARARSNADLDERASDTPKSTCRSSRRLHVASRSRSYRWMSCDAPRPGRSRSTSSLGRLCLATNPHDTDSPARLRYKVTRLAVSRNYGRLDARCPASTRRLATVGLRDATQSHAWRVPSVPAWGQSERGAPPLGRAAPQRNLWRARRQTVPFPNRCGRVRGRGSLPDDRPASDVCPISTSHSCRGHEQTPACVRYCPPRWPGDLGVRGPSPTF